MSDQIRVLLVDDQVLVRRGLRRLLELEPGVEVAGEAADGQEALDLLATGLPVDVALVDARMPGMDGMTLIHRMRADHAQIATLLLTTFDEDELLFGSLSAGADGFLLKDVEPEDLVRALRTVCGRALVIDEHVAPRMVARLTSGGTAATGYANQSAGADQRAAPDRGGHGGPACDAPTGSGHWQVTGSPELTARELEIAGLVAEGASNREIAETLFLTEGTVKNHVSAALRKLGLRDRTQLALTLHRKP